MSLIKKYLTNKYAFISAGILLLGIVLSILGSKFLFDYTKQQQQLWIERNSETKAEKLQLSINAALNTLSSISAFFHVDENINQNRFLKFVESDAAIKTGILALAWVPRIKHEERASFEKTLNKELRGFRQITESNGHGLILPAPTRDEYFPIQNIFSVSDTELFTGLNITSLFNTRNNLNSAIATGNLLTTQGMRASLKEPDRKIFQAYFPVYNTDRTTNEKSNKTLSGFSVGIFDIQTLVNNTFTNTNSLNLILLDVDSKKTDQLLYKPVNDAADLISIKNIHDLAQLETPYWTRYFDVGNRKWLGVFITNELETNYNKPWIPYLGLVFGLLITSALAIYLFIASIRGRQINTLKYKLDDSEQLSKELESESLEKTRFLHALGHDLRQPLSTLGLYLAQFNIHEEDKNKSVLDKTRLTFKSLANMFESMLEITRLEAGTIEPKISVIDLESLFQKFKDEFDLPLQSKKLDLHIRCNAPFVNSDPVLLEGILRNLLTNAIKFTDNGKILIASRNVRNKIIIYIMDTGQGISETDIDNILKPYTRGDAISDENGLGLGLAIVKHSAGLLGHQLEIRSKLHIGSCFKIIINK